MGIRRVVNTDFWKDDVVAERYSAEDRYFMLYLLTNPNTKQCGIYHLPIRTMAFELGYTQDATRSIVDRFENKFKNIVYSQETNEIAILNFLKHSIIKGGKPVEDCIRKELEQVKDKHLILKVYKHLLKFMEEQIDYKTKANKTSMYVGIKNVFEEFINEEDIENDIENDNDNDNDNDNERIVPRIVDESYQVIINRLNELAGTNFRSTGKSTRDLIKNLLKDYTEEDILMVVEKMCYKWASPKKGEKDMSEYLRPSTLFRRSNFENYLGMKVQERRLTTKDIPIDISDF